MTGTRGRRILLASMALGVGLTSIAGCSAEKPSSGPAAADGGGAASSSPTAKAGAGSANPDPHSQDPGTESADEPAVATPSPGLPTLGPDRLQTDVLRRLPGSAGAACVAVGTARDVRAGGFAAGPFDTARAQGEAGAKTVRLYFVPEHSRSMPGIVVAGRNAQSGATFERRKRAVADAEEFRLYDLELPATTGTWRITASAGADAGCWTVDLG